MLRVGVIGTGAMGQHHVRIYSEIDDVELIGISDVDEKRVTELGKQFNITSYTDYNKLLSQKLDAVSIAVPTTFHKQVALDAIAEGTNILVEKPLTDTLENADAIISAAHDAGLTLMVGHVERFNPIIPVIKQSIQKLKVVSIDIIRVGPLPPRVNDVGVIKDLAIHDIDLIRYLTNSEFKNMCSMISRNISTNEDTAVLSFEMENGVLAHITTNWLTPFKVREISIALTDKFIKGSFIDQKVTEYSQYNINNSYLVKELNVIHAEPLQIELKAFIKSVIEKSSPPVTGQDGRKALEVAVNLLKGHKKECGISDYAGTGFE